MSDMTTSEGIAALASLDAPVSALVAALMLRSSEDRNFTLSELVAGEKRSRLHAEITLRLVRQRIYDLISSPWAPSTSAIEAALSPDYELVSRLVEEQVRREEAQES